MHSVSILQIIGGGVVIVSAVLLGLSIPPLLVGIIAGVGVGLMIIGRPPKIK